MKRLSDWRARLDRYLDDVDTEHFQWGVFDCGIFVAGCIKAMTDVDLAAGIAGSYSDFAGSIRVLRKRGYQDHVAYFAAHLREIHPSEATHGDIAVVPAVQGQYSLALVNNQSLICLSESGRRPLSRSAALRAFRVEF